MHMQNVIIITVLISEKNDNKINPPFEATTTTSFFTCLFSVSWMSWTMFASSQLTSADRYIEIIKNTINGVNNKD